MNNSQQRKAGAILSYVTIIVNTLITLLYTPFMTSKLGQSEYGLYSMVSSIIGYLTMLDLGFGNALIVYTAKFRKQQKYDEERKLHGMFFIIFCIIGFIAGSLGLILFFNVNNLFAATLTSVELEKMKVMMLILTFNLSITFLFSIYSSIISAYEKFVFQKVLALLNTALRHIVMIPFLLFGYKSICMTLIVTVINIIVLISNYLYCRKKLNIHIKYSGFDKKLFKQIIGYSFFIFLGVIVDKINWSLDSFILGAVSGTVAVSVYAMATNFSTLFINLSKALSGVFLPKISKMVARGASDEELTNEFIKVGRLQFYVIFLMITGFILVGREFIISWAGKEYINSYYIAVILIVPSLFTLVQNMGLSIMQAKNMHKFRSVLLIFIALANVVVSIPLAKLYEGIGSALGTGASLIVGNVIILNIYYYKKVHLNVIKFWKDILKMVLYFLVPITLVIILSTVVTLSGFAYVILLGSVYVILYMVTAYLFVMNSYEKNIIHSIVNKFLRKKVS